MSGVERLAYLIALVCALGCGSTKLRGSGPHGAGDFPPGSLAYYLGMDMLEVDLDLSYDMRRTFQHGKWVLTEELVGAAGTASLKTVADDGKLYGLALEPGGLSQTDLKLTVGDDGLLQSVSVQAHGKAGEAIRSIATFAATLAGLSGGGVPRFAPPTTNGLSPLAGMAIRKSLRHPLASALTEEGKILAIRQGELEAQRERASKEREALEGRIRDLIAQGSPLPASTAPLVARLEERLASVVEHMRELDGLRARVVLQRAVVDAHASTIVVSSDPRHAHAVLLMAEDSEARDLYASILLFGARIEAARLDRDATGGYLSAQGHEKTKAEGLKVQRDTIQSSITSLEAERAALQGRFDALLAAFRAYYKLGERRVQRKLRQVVRLTDLPADSGGGPPAKGPMQSLWEEAGVYITLERVTAGSVPAEAVGNAETAGKDDTHVYYRRPVPVVLRLYSRFKEFGKGDGEGRPEVSCPVCAGPVPVVPQPVSPPGAGAGVPALQDAVSLKDATHDPSDNAPHLIGSYLHDVLLADTPPASLAFRPNAFADRSLVLGFSGGRLLTVHQSSTAAVAGATAALSGAAQAARDEFDATLTKLKNIKTTQRDIGLIDLDTRIMELERRKQIVDKEVALEGATAARDLEIERLKLQAEMLLLQQQLSLSASRAGAEVHDEIEKMKAEIARLQQEQALIKLQREVEELKKAKAE